MRHLVKVLPQGQGIAPVLLKRAPSLSLDWDARQKSRFGATVDGLGEVAVLLPRGSVLRGGDVLVADDGALVRVIASPQPVLQVRHCAQHGSPFDLLRAAYHLGNRHVPLELQPDLLQLEPDPVLAEMLRRQHLIVAEAQAAFEPEAGAYGEGAGHGHHHGHGQSHDHDHEGVQAQSPAPAPARKSIAIPVVAAAPAHVHGPDCGHDHGH
jgi:urease accessory protein